MTAEQKLARRRWRGNLNDIPVEIAYDFELVWIIQNEREHGFRGSARRVSEARAEFKRRNGDRVIHGLKGAKP